ncbi:fasciclin domain-containing protein [Nonomuraea basaltis]|uniref:fasciclin domain-containing protein n=1 Tax=Nonomuraea basaltis TaxID=2495887 RepID=UPI001F0DE96F|nr:fasciclin domain-containing protein [Nonomuraea basaltis]
MSPAPEDSPADMSPAPEDSPADMSPAPEDSPPATSPSPEGSPFGAGCAPIEGNLADLAKQPVGTALSGVSELSTLAEAVQQAGLAERLNSAKDITVFAPNNEAFEAIPQETRDKVMGDKNLLIKILTYHVVEGRKPPAELEDATLKTLEGGELTMKGSGEDLTVNDAKVVCGNIPTSNATVYIIDKVLTPQ